MSYFTFPSLTDHYINSWKYTDATPLSNTFEVFSYVILYFVIIKICRWIVATRGKPFDLNWFVILHNGYLSVFSGVLFVALLVEIYAVIVSTGFWDLFCDPTAKRNVGRIYFIYYINYIFKYVELIDTWLLALRGKEIPFLHSYHHAATLLLCFSQLHAESCIQWLPIVINLFVHVVMYAYYALHAMGVNVWWKKYLTLLQIIQFVAGITGCVTATGFRFAAQLDFIPSYLMCHGTAIGCISGIACLSSYLFLFVQLYSAKYTPAQKKEKKSE